jgi:protoheme IX farnesyltransferase
LLVLALSVLVSSASAGAFNQYYEHDSDHLMSRTSKRPFVTGELRHGPIWLLVIAALMALSVGAAWIALNAWSALFVFLGAFFYAIVYTVWLKRRTWLNIVFGGLAGSWAVLAGATAADPQLGAVPLALALVLFLWTPPHFWSLAIAFRDDYAAAGVPMLPVVVGDQRAANTIFYSTLALVAASLLPLAFGLGRSTSPAPPSVASCSSRKPGADARPQPQVGDGLLPCLADAADTGPAGRHRGHAACF